MPGRIPFGTDDRPQAAGPLPAIILALLASAYLAAQMLADITSLKLTEVAGWSVDAGTLVYPITFTLRDLIHKIAGARVARTMIVAAAVINLLMAGLFWLVAQLPAIPDVGPQTELFGDVLAPVWRIVFASIVAEVLSELIDTEVSPADFRPAPGPDFSATGGPMQFGYLRANTSRSEREIVLQHGIDNWTVELFGE